MYSREKLTIKGRASRHVLPPKNALQTKRVHRRYFSELSVLYGNCSDEIEKDRNCP